MSNHWKKMGAAIAVTVLMGSVGFTKPLEAAAPKAGPKRTVNVTVRGGKNLTVLLVSGTGRTLASKKITKTTQKVTLKTVAVSTTAGMNLQLVNSGGTSSGEYFGPVVLGWKGTAANRASRVYTRLKSTKSSVISLGTINVTKVGTAKKQGYATVTKKVSLANTSASVAVVSSKGRPSGVGTYGKKAAIGAQSVTGSSVSVSASNLPATPTPPNPPQPNQQQPNQQQPNQPQGEGAVAKEEDTLGGDKDKDGIPNAFDVDDDGDGKSDASDTDTPTPVVSADDGVKDCGSIRWNIFTNFKATGENFVGTLNAYGTGVFESKGASTATAVTNTMTMVFAPITQVCGSAVTKTEIKGNGVSYAPATYQEVSRTCSTGDYQWLIGKGRMCDTGGQGYAFHTPNTFSATDLPSGQDTFSMRVTTASGVYEFTSSPGFVFVSHPMLASYSIDGGAEQTINYGSNIPRIGISNTSVLTLKLHRPQRFAIDGEGGVVYDLGGFRYTADIPNGTAQGSQGPGKCDASTVTDTVMTSDTVINPSTKPVIELRWDIGKCFQSRSTAWQTGNLTVDIQVEPAGPGGNSAQKLFLALS
jgi:hypothetical protein